MAYSPQELSILQTSADVCDLAEEIQIHAWEWPLDVVKDQIASLEAGITQLGALAMQLEISGQMDRSASPVRLLHGALHCAFMARKLVATDRQCSKEIRMAAHHPSMVTVDFNE